MSRYGIRPGEVQLPFDPAVIAADARLQFIGRIRTPWRSRAECPKNGGESDALCIIEVDAAFAPGLRGIETSSHLIVLYWMHEARRDLIVQSPSFDPEVRGCFALRTPVRPNPIAVGIVELVRLRESKLEVRGLDCLDATPLLDLKPYFASTDARPEARVGWHQASLAGRTPR
jgi:tRNA-Thr(GGU) m(6)t(6)A37 methyltransferase TsaA